MNPRSVGIFAVVVAFVVGGALWFLNSDYAPHAVPKPDPTEIAKPKPGPSAPPSSENSDLPPTPPKTPEVASTQNVPPTTPVTPQPVLSRDDQMIDEILRLPNDGSDQANTATAQKLIQLLTQLSPEGQVECVSHISNLLTDEEYSRILPVWKNPSFNPDVLEAIYTDLMNRDDKVKLPALLEAVRLPNHPEHENAKSTLEIFLDQDYENDVGKWERGVKAFLKKQADEEAGLN